MKKIIGVFFLLLLSVCWVSNSVADSVRENIFSDVNDALRDADLKQANILAPKSYAKAIKSYQSASKRYDKGQSVERIQKDLDSASAFLQKSIDASALAKLTFATCITARDDAVKASSEKFATDLWNKAEKSFNSAVVRLETGSLKSAQRSANEAEKLFREAELVAIKATYLNETRALIEQAKKNKAEKYAPITLSKAYSLLSQAEKALSEDRYDTDQPRALAREAKYEAKHASYLALTVEPVVRKKKTVEALLLEMEEPLVKIGGALDLVPQLDGSLEDPSAQIRDNIAQLQKQALELVHRNNELAKLENEMQELEIRLGMQSQRLEKQEKRRQQFESIERMFSSNEAVVLKQGDNILLRMVGLNFKSGAAGIETENFALLKKIQRALDVFPKASVVIEGHTDSFGSDSANLELSQKRAVSVRTYLLTNMADRSATSTKAVGYGESQPIANNETPEGRTKNRRIDIKIQL